MKLMNIMLSLLVAISLQAMTSEEARHLISRTHFGVTSPLLEQYEKMSYERAVYYLLKQSTNIAVSPEPKWINETLEKPDREGLSDDELRELQRIQRLMRRDLQLWWYGEMFATSSELTEMMTLFWHNHFVSSMDKVRSPKLMYKQNVLFRAEALGSYKTLLYAIIRDPAMLIYLDNTTNTKTSPNENLGRELLELFSLGEGAYSEDDVKNAARALTGYGIDRNRGTFKFARFQHDYGSKEFLGQSGRFDGEDIVRIILEDDETAHFIVRKMWRYFISNYPDENEVEKFATIFRNSDYEIKPLLDVMFNSEAFKNRSNYSSLIKSPVELTVGTVKSFEYEPRDYALFIGINRRLQQDIFYPPNVKGWQGYKEWINTTTLLERRSVLEKAAIRMNAPDSVLNLFLDPAYQLK